MAIYNDIIAVMHGMINPPAFHTFLSSSAAHTMLLTALNAARAMASSMTKDSPLGSVYVSGLFCPFYSYTSWQ